MRTYPTLVGLALLFLLGCGGSVQVVPVAGLDYLEVSDPTGWRLRVYGNGSGSISHEQLPAYHLHYPCATFRSSLLRQRPKKCLVPVKNQACTILTAYSATEDSLYHCDCTNGAWAEELMIVAVDRMDTAVDAGESERSCRMLRRQWLLR